MQFNTIKFLIAFYFQFFSLFPGLKTVYQCALLSVPVNYCLLEIDIS